MRMISVSLAILLFCGLFAGCQNDNEVSYSNRMSDRLVTPAETARERELRINQITTQQLRMLVDDWDELWLYSRSSRLTPWYVDVGF